MPRSKPLSIVPKADDDANAGSVDPQPQPAPEPELGVQIGVRAQREALRAAGKKRCPAHVQYFPDEDPIRDLSEFGHEASCKRCVKQRTLAKKAAQPHSGPTQRERRLARLISKRDALTAQIAALEQHETA